MRQYFESKSNLWNHFIYIFLINRLLSIQDVDGRAILATTEAVGLPRESVHPSRLWQYVCKNHPFS